MIVDIDSLKRIIGNTKNVVVYGLASCRYLDLSTSLSKQGYEIDKSLALFQKRPRIQTMSSKAAPRFAVKYQCKSIINDLILYNYQRLLNNEPVIPLLFCTSFESETESQNININHVLTSNKHSQNITNSELKRIYKIFHESSGLLKQAAAKTIIFVRLRQHAQDHNQYSVERMEPIWDTDEWKAQWQLRANRTRQNDTKKTRNWRANFFSAATTLLQQSQTQNSNDRAGLVTLIRSRL